MCIINFESSLDNDNTNDGNCGWKIVLKLNLWFSILIVYLYNFLAVILHVLITNQSEKIYVDIYAYIER